MKKLVLSVALATLTLSGCARNMDSGTYVSSDAAGVVVEGVVVSARPVTIKETDKLQDNALGGLAGGVAGGAIGNTIGGGSGKTVATVGGAIGGAVLGAMIQDQLSSSDGMEYVVKVSKQNQNTDGRTYTSKDSISINGSKIQQKITDNLDTNMKTELISVVQGKDVVFQPGQRVYVIYTDGRPRLTAANY
jgi:outer membrane lipoprotein SlyB